jgi:hypothetical protein
MESTLITGSILKYLAECPIPVEILPLQRSVTLLENLTALQVIGYVMSSERSLLEAIMAQTSTER